MIRAALLATAGITAALVLTSAPTEAKEVACEVGTGLKALNGDTKSTITFTNRTPDKQTVYWIDYDGKRHKYQELDPGESYDQPTFLSHPWLVTGLRDNCVGYYLAEGQKTAVEPGIAPIIKPINAPKQTKKVAKRPKLEKKPVVRKPVAKVRVPEISDDDFEDDFPEDARDTVTDDTTVARRRFEEPAARDDEDQYDYENDEDEEDDRRTVRRRTEDPDRNNDQDRYDDDENDVAIAEPLARPGNNRSISPEWDDAPLNNGRSDISRDWRCTEYNSRTEAAICSDRRLSRLDDELERLYSSLVRRLPRGRRTQLRRQQQRWLENREACGQRTNCIERRTQRRMAGLNRRMERLIAGRGVSRNNDRRQFRCPRGYRRTNEGDCVRSRDRTSVGRRLPSTGQSLGGRVRDIPGLDGRRIASLPEGTPVTVLESTGEQLRGYEWFKVRFGVRTGYTWGGILCTDNRVPGVFKVCR